MMFLIVLTYFSLMEPFGFQKEESARSLMSQIGHEDVRPEFQSMMDAANCRLEAMNPEGVGKFREPEAALICTVATPCGQPFERVVYHKRLLGAFTTAEPTRTTIYSVCPDMLNAAALKDAEAHWQQGG